MKPVKLMLNVAVKRCGIYVGNWSVEDMDGQILAADQVEFRRQPIHIVTSQLARPMWAYLRKHENLAPISLESDVHQYLRQPNSVRQRVKQAIESGLFTVNLGRLEAEPIGGSDEDE